MKRLLVCLGALVGLMAMPARADAALFTINQGESFTAVFDTPDSGQTVCASCSIEVEFALSADGLTLTLTVENTSTSADALANALAALGFDSDPTLTDANSNVALGGNLVGWNTAYNSGGGGLGGTWEFIADANADNLLNKGETGTITFTLASAITSFSLDDALVHIQRTGADRQGSTKFECCTEGEEGTTEAEGQGPEPASLLLFGVALSAAGLRMRRARA